MTAEERKIVENKISELKKEMNDVHGSKCEVYSRVVGYLRPCKIGIKAKKKNFPCAKPCMWKTAATATAVAANNPLLTTI